MRDPKVHEDAQHSIAICLCLSTKSTGLLARWIIYFRSTIITCFVTVLDALASGCFCRFSLVLRSLSCDRYRQLTSVPLCGGWSSAFRLGSVEN